MAGGAGAANLAANLGLKGTAKAGLTFAGTAIPNLAQEGQYLDKVEAFKQINGRKPTKEELKQIQNVAFAEKATNTALESIADRMLFGKLFTQGNATKGLKNIAQNVLQQGVTEATTEGMQEGVSIGAEKVLGLNQGDNAERLLESTVIGGLTGGIIGGSATALSQPYDTQFKESNIAKAIKEVSSKIINDGKNLYNSSINNSDTFDNLKTLSRDGSLSNKKSTNTSKLLKEIAPKTYKKQNEVDNENIIDLEPGKDYFITDDIQNSLLQQKQKLLTTKNKETKVEYPLSTYVQSMSDSILPASNTDVKDDLKNIAPKTFEKQNERMHTKSFKKGDIVKDVYTDEVFEIIEPDKRGIGHLRNVDTDEITTINAHNNARYIKYSPNENEFIKTEEFKYNPKANRSVNANNYVYAQQEVVDAYNEYFKNPTSVNKEKYQDIYGKKLEEYNELEPMLKDVGSSLPAFKNEKKQDNINTKKTGKYLPNKKAEAYAILSKAIGKNVKWIQMQKNKSLEKISDLIDRSSDKIQLGDFGHLQYYPEAEQLAFDNTNESVGKGAEIARKAFNDILNDNFYEKNDKYDNYSSEDFKNELEHKINKLSGQIKIQKVKDLVEQNREITEEDYNDLLKDIHVKSDEEVALIMADYELLEQIETKRNLLNEFETKLEKEYNNQEVKDGKSKNEARVPRNIQSEPSKISKSVGRISEPRYKNKSSNVHDANNESGTRGSVGKTEQLRKTKHKQITDLEKIAPKTYKKQELQKQLLKAEQQFKENLFIPEEEKQVLLENLKSEEKEFYIQLAQKFEDIINNAPGMYQTEGIELEDKKPVLHYFGGSYNNYVFEIDKETGELFGAVSFNDSDFELGYSSMEEINSFRSNFVGPKYLVPSIELDLYYDNTQTFAEIINKNKQVDVEKASKNGNNNIEEVYDNGIDRSTNQAGNRGNSEKLSERLYTDETMVRDQSEMADRDDKGSIGQNRYALTSNNVDVGNERIIDEHKAIIEKTYKNQHELNQSIENFINNKEYKKYNLLPIDIKNWLKKYTGAGGLEKQGAEGRGLLSEYYTPNNVAKKMWDITAQYIDVNGAKVLEPSVGIGRFLEDAPENIKFDVFEINPVSAKITELLYSNANVINSPFQERFINKETNSPVKKVAPEYDIVIGNPPYGQYSGRYKGLGEGKNISRIEYYFIKRGLDTLKENGVLTFIVPSSFLDSSITKAKQEIGIAAELIDAYRLPENIFDTTSVGTDIIVLRKNKNNGKASLLNAGNWYKEHPEKILGTKQIRTNRFGKEETYVKGDKNIVESIDTSKKDIKTVVEENSQTEVKTESVVRKNKTTLKKQIEDTKKGNIEYTRYKHENPISEKELQYFVDTRVDGTLPKGKYSPNEKVNLYNGNLYNDFNYLQGNIYEKLDALEKENISEKQKEMQRKKLMSVLPKRKNLEQINLTPTSDFIREYQIIDRYYDKYDRREVEEKTYLDRKYLKYVENLSRSERNGISIYDIDKFVRGGKISVSYRGNPTKEEKENQRAEYLTKLKNTVDKTFNDFLNSELSIDEINKLTDIWNRTFNNLYTPDYKKMPMIVQDLNSQFKGKKLVLQDVQIEGINFLTNKGVGLLGFEVGVGKTLSGIIATVQNLQMGRCKRPLIIVPKQVKPNWIKEIKEAFPNIKVNDLDNLGNFNEKIDDGSVSIATFQALDNIWYSQSTINNLLMNTYQVSNDFNRDSTKRGKEKAKERNEEFIGEAEKDNKKKHTFEELGFDHITVDEAHNFKNLFSSAKADGQDGNTYSKITGAESTRAKRMFLATQYILSNNDNRNVFMLTATPFNNSPLEVFNMLSYIAKDKLDNMGLYNVYQFMENYVDITADWVVDSKNNVVYKQIPKAFKNLQSLQSVIDSCMLIRSADDAGIERPNKHTIRVVLEPTQEQLDMIARAEAEAVGFVFDEEGNIISAENKKDGGAVLKAISKARTATLSPAIYKSNIEVSPEEFIKSSPKLEYVMNAIEAMKKKDPTTGQLLYMPLGVDFLPKIKQYLVNKKVFKPEEIAIIKSGVNDEKITGITDSFNNKDGVIKLIIGTNKMREGMNLNGHTSVLYVPYMDWNPTDYLQVVGRIWRRGNDYKDIRIVVPLLKDSSDPFMFQKLDEKTSRINNIMDRGKDYIDTAELDTAEEKINMITNPDKKAAMFSQIEEQKLRNEKNKLEGQLETTNHYLKELTNLENSINDLEGNIDRNENRLKTIENKDGWEYSSVQSYIEKYKKELARTKQTLKYTKARIERLELDFNGKDSETAIKEKIQEVEKKLANLKEITEEKRIEYRKEYEKNRKTSKSISEYIKEFDKQTDDLYKGNIIKHSKNEDYPFLNINNRNRIFFLRNQQIIYDGRKVSSIGEIRKNPEFEAIKDLFDSKHDDIEIRIMPDYMRNDDFDAYYNPKDNCIYIDENVTPEIIVHEYTHLMDFEVNKFDPVHWIEYYLYDIKGKSVDELKKDIIEGIALENEEIAKKRLEGDNNGTFRRPARATKTLLQRFAKGEIKISDFVRFIKTAARTRKASSRGKSETRGNNVKHSNGQTQKRETAIVPYKNNNIIINNDINIDVDEILPKVKKPKDKIVEKIFTPISTRLENINPSLKHAIRKFELDSALTENKYANIITPFVEKLSKMPVVDYAKYDLALKNGRKETIRNLNIKYNLFKEYKNIRKLLDEIREEAINVGLDVGYIEDYFPRRVINPSAILEEYSKSSYIRKLLKEVDPNNTLSDEEKLEKINIALKGYNGAINANSSFVKNRKITEITKDLNRYYKDSKMALVDYITSMNNAIQVRKFFGKGENLEESIGAYTRDLLDKGIISPADEVELKQILKARFNQRGVKGVIQDVKNIGYIFSMGNPFSAITQLGDFAFSFYKNGIFDTMVGVKKSLSDNKVSREDIGINKIAQEFESDSKTSKLLEKVFKIVGLHKIDTLGKETFVNAALNKLQNKANNALKNPNSIESAKFKKELYNIFGNNSYRVLNDLNKGNISDDVKYLLFSEISDFQPISLAEMPEIYLTSGNGRIFYMLKTYSIKLLDVYRNEVFKQFKINPKLGLQNLIRLSFYVTLLGVGADGLKDFLMGREFDFEATFLDNILKLAMFSEYKLSESKREGIAKAVMTLMLPPTNVFDDLWKDTFDNKFITGEKSLKDLRSLRNIPAVGKLYYWWFGGGLNTKEKEFKKNRKKEYINSFINKDKKLFNSTTQKMKDKGYSNKEITKIIKQSRSEYIKPYKQDFSMALMKKDKEKAKRVIYDMKKEGISDSERKKIYEQAFKEYVKNKNQ